MKKLVSLMLAAMLTLSTLAGCSSSSSESSSASSSSSSSSSSTGTEIEVAGLEPAAGEDSIVIGIGVEAVTMDPHATTAHQSRQIYCNIYDSLLTKNDDGTFAGRLASSWEISEDSLEYTFYLEEGVLFHNGEEFTAADVKYSFERGMESAHVNFLYAGITAVEVVDTYTVKVILENPSATLLEVMTLPQTHILNEKAVTEAGEDYGRNPVGTGPYQFVSWTSGESIELVAFEDYFRGEAPITNVKFRFITDKSTGTIVLEKGEIDVYYDPTTVDVERLQTNEDLVYEDIAGTSYEMLVINNLCEPFDNVLVRQALAYAVNNEDVLIAGDNGVGFLAESQIPSTMPGYSENVTAYPYDTEMAKSLLAEAGYPDGFECTMTVNSGYREKEAQVIQAYLSMVGIDMKIEVLEWGTLLTDLADGNYELSLVGKNLHIADPAITTANCFGTEYMYGGGNLFLYSNPDFDSMMAAAMVEMDTDVRNGIFEDILELLHEEVPNVPYYWKVNSLAFNKNLNGINVLAMSHYEVYNFYW